MYRWYEKAALCFVFLADYTTGDGESRLSECRWFTRGFTLQELLAPQTVMFFDSKLNTLGTRSSLAHKIAAFTHIASTYLLDHDSCRTASVAQRMSWASRRQTSRSEDIAYSLLGLFNVNMPLLYGEGALQAFRRLQYEIIAQSTDESIFAWTSETADGRRGMFANSPSEFASCQHIHRSVLKIRRPAYRTTNRGVEFAIPATAGDWTSRISPRTHGISTWVQLECEYRERPRPAKSVSICLERSAHGDGLWYRMHPQKLNLDKHSNIWQSLKTLCYGYIQVYISEPETSEDRRSYEVRHPTTSSVIRQFFINFIICGVLAVYLALGLLLVTQLYDESSNHISLTTLIWLWLTCGWKVSRYSYRYLTVVLAGVMDMLVDSGPWALFLLGFIFYLESVLIVMGPTKFRSWFEIAIKKCWR
jgi:hypothetical protein